MKEFIKKILFDFRKRSRQEKAFGMEKIWRLELAAAGILLVLMMGFDFWIYQTFVRDIKEASLPQAAEGFVLLDKKGLEDSFAAISSHREFLKNPSPPALLNDPF